MHHLSLNNSRNSTAIGLLDLSRNPKLTNQNAPNDILNLTAMFLLAIPVFTVGGNALVIISIMRQRSLQSMTNYFIFSLAIADLCVALFVMPFAVYIEVTGGKWFLGSAVCDLYVAADVTLSTASILSLVAISADRFIAVSRPIQYSMQKGKKRAVVTIVLVWVASISIASPIFFGINEPDIDIVGCTFVNYIFIIASSVGSFFVPLGVMVLLYAVIFHRLRQRRQIATKQLNQNQNHENNLNNCQKSVTSFVNDSNAGTAAAATASDEQRSATKDSKDENNYVMLKSSQSRRHSSLVNTSQIRSPYAPAPGKLPDSGPSLRGLSCSRSSSSKPPYHKNNNNKETDDRERLIPLFIDRSCRFSSVYSFTDDDAAESSRFYAENYYRTFEQQFSSSYHRQAPFATLESVEDFLDWSPSSLSLLPGNQRQASTTNPSPTSSLTPEQQQKQLLLKRSRHSILANVAAHRPQLNWQSLVRSCVKKGPASPFYQRATKTANAREAKRDQRERKATQTVAIVMGVFLLCWLPFISCHFANSICLYAVDAGCIDFTTFFLTSWLGYMNSFMNPIIYTIFNAEFRKAFRKIIKCKR